MKKALFLCLLAALAALLFAQQPRSSAPGRIVTGGSSGAPLYAPYDLLSVFPQETSAGLYQQVDASQLQALADQGWQLVSVAPYVYRNEGSPTASSQAQASSPPPPLVTQVYLAYFFQRARLIR